MGLIKNSITANVLPTSFGSTLEDFFKVSEHAEMNQRERERPELLWGICPVHHFASNPNDLYKPGPLLSQRALHI